MQRRTLLAPVPVAGSFIDTSDGQRLFNRDVGAGRPVVFIHGWPLSSAIWRDQIDWLAAEGLRIVAYDRRGHGQSSRPDDGYDYDRLASDLEAVLDRPDPRAVTVPTLVLYGTADALIMPINARRTQQGIAGSRLEIYEGAPHALFLTDTERFNRDLLQFARS